MGPPLVHHKISTHSLTRYVLDYEVGFAVRSPVWPCARTVSSIQKSAFDSGYLSHTGDPRRTVWSAHHQNLVMFISSLIIIVSVLFWLLHFILVWLTYSCPPSFIPSCPLPQAGIQGTIVSESPCPPWQLSLWGQPKEESIIRCFIRTIKEPSTLVA